MKLRRCGLLIVLPAWPILGAWSPSGALGGAGARPAADDGGRRPGREPRRAVADQLEKAGAIRGRRSDFRGFARVFGSQRADPGGRIRDPAGHASGAAILEHAPARHGRCSISSTIPEGMPSVLVHERLMRAAAADRRGRVPAEGSVLPDSYSISAARRRAAVLPRMQAAMRAALGAAVGRAQAPTRRRRARARR